MKRICIILFLTSLTIFAQQEAITKDGKKVLLNKDGTWKYISETVTSNKQFIGIPEKRNFNHPTFSEDFNSEFRFETKYDKFENSTLVSINVKLTQLNSDLTIGSFFIYQGEKLVTPKTVTLRFVSSSSDWEYLHNSNIVFLVDGKRIDLGEMKRNGRVGNGYVLEFLSLTLPTNTLLEIINGKVVEAKLFTTTFKLTEEQLEAFRDYASRMQ